MKKFTLPESLADLTAEQLTALRKEAVAEIQEINSSAPEGELLPVEKLDAIEELLKDVDAIDTRSTEVKEAADAIAARQAAARERLAGLEPAEEPAAEEPAAEEPAAEPAAEPVQEQDAVLASGTRRRAAAKIAGKSSGPTVIVPKGDEPKSVTSIVAAANLRDHVVDQKLADMSEVANAFLSAVADGGHQNPADMKTGVRALSPNATKRAVARVKRSEDREFAVDRDMSAEQQFSIIMEAAKESRLSGGSVIAAGGWCAPSEIMYDFCELETSEGTLDVPEVTAKRGGIQFTKGPDFMTLFGDADAGFIQTEAQAEAGTEKPCYAIECPPFTEVRLDAIGFCVTAPLLTNAGYPELVRRVLNLLTLGHARRKSQSTINRISTMIGTAINWAEVGGTAGSATADVLSALELQALRIRQVLALSPTATIEGIAPFWGRAALRSDLSRRLGLASPFQITDADVDSYLALRGISLQYVYDYQMLTTTNTATWTKFPDTIEIMLYPAGSFVRLTNDVINLDAVYDHDLLTQNTYTAAFMEEGIAVANTCGFGVKVQVSLNYLGSSGFPGVGAVAGVAFAPAA